MIVLRPACVEFFKAINSSNGAEFITTRHCRGKLTVTENISPVLKKAITGQYLFLCATSFSLWEESVKLCT